MKRLVRVLLRGWQLLRRLVGDDAYERYCEHRRLCHPRESLLDRRGYYLEAQRRKWSGVNRCC
jgi:uncharacterized short protein YbdD (DUF466 family)